MTDTQKLIIIDKIISTAYEFVPADEEVKSGYYEGIVNALYAVITADPGGEDNV